MTNFHIYTFPCKRFVKIGKRFLPKIMTKEKLTNKHYPKAEYSGAFY